MFLRHRTAAVTTAMALIGAVSTVAVAAPPAGGGEIVSLQGKGESRAVSDSSWREATVKQQLAQGASVRTLDASRMAVLLFDQTQVRLAPNSVIEIKQVSDGAARATQLKQSAGRTWAQSKNVPDKLTIETPTALAAIRGTDWEMVVDEDGTSTLTVLSGEVLLSTEQGTINVGAGEQGRATKGVTPVKTLLVNPRDRVQWVSSFVVDVRRYPDLLQRPELATPVATNELLALRREALKLASSPGAPASALLLASDFQVQDGELDAAVKALQAGALRFPTDERFDVWRARVHLLQDDSPAARAALASARQRNPRSGELLLTEGALERLEGNAGASTIAYRSAIALVPDLGRAWHGLGIVQTEREDVTNARTSLTRALELEPQGTGFLAELGTLEALTERLDAARTAFTQALQERPDDYVALTGLALVELKLGNTEEATRRLLAATLIEPRYARAQTYLAVAYYQQGRSRDALFALERARALDPKDPLPNLYQSVIHNDHLRPGDALAYARKAMVLLPHLKSLNQVANDQKGSANLGAALAAFGLEDWARSYAQDSYNPFWAGSHLFLADRYSGDFNKKSELFQGFLTDPTVFGASNRFSTLMTVPGSYGSLGWRYNASPDFKVSEPTLTVNGYANATLPLAYFVEAIRTNARPDQLAFDAGAKTYTLALGARPSHALGLFVYANALDSNIALGSTNAATNTETMNRINGRNQRVDAGAHYRFGPQSQAWLKLGQGSESSLISTANYRRSLFGAITQVSDFETRPQQRDVQMRYSLVNNDRHEFSVGAELADMEKDNTLLRENSFHLPGASSLADRLTQHDEDRSRDVWLSSRLRVSNTLLIQGDLAWQHYTKARDIVIDRGRIPPVRQTFVESFDTSLVAPRLGFAWQAGSGATLRGAYQKWLHPASNSTLAPVATAGLALDDSLSYPGGSVTRTRAQLDWEVSPAWFVKAFADQRDIENLNSPLDGVLNTRADVTNLDRLRQHSVPNLAAEDQLEASPVFSRGTVRSGGLALNHVLSRQAAGYIGYTHTQSGNRGLAFNGNDLPYLPLHRATLGVTWFNDQRLLVSAQAIWRSRRFADEANLLALAAGWDMTLRMHWESIDKRWALDGYAGNLLKRDTGRLMGVNGMLRF
jgi:Flp pilus assembly protein TadD